MSRKKKEPIEHPCPKCGNADTKPLSPMSSFYKGDVLISVWRWQCNDTECRKVFAVRNDGT